MELWCTHTERTFEEIPGSIVETILTSNIRFEPAQLKNTGMEEIHTSYDTPETGFFLLLGRGDASSADPAVASLGLDFVNMS